MSCNSSSLGCILVLFALAIIKIHARVPTPVARLNYEMHVIKGDMNTPIVGSCTSPSHGFTVNFTLNHSDEQVQWQIRLRRNVRAIYVCLLIKNRNERKRVIVFDQAIDIRERRCGRTGMCFYKLEEDGIYFADDNVSYNRELAWDHYN
ncbi:uncharacterized protein LOC126667342 [Mercurialis annua]|uniref:uncharacterized protein LOC126667342 n=1 Tax=Mercurialis annua TaxID=3986 RepID=UPI00215EFB03|nr:uncharacterized protein LOC126667342 [Mercurialis annua]